MRTLRSQGARLIMASKWDFVAFLLNNHTPCFPLLCRILESAATGKARSTPLFLTPEQQGKVSV
jgi:hypothetical protein